MQFKRIFPILLRVHFILTFTCMVSVTQAQYFEFNWSDEYRYTNHKDGFFDGFTGANSMCVYALNTNYAVSHLNRHQKLLLTAYDKTNMTEVATVALKGFPENKPATATYEPLQYYKSVVLEDRVLVFWTRLINTDSTRTDELYVESYKTDLKREQQVRLVYSAVQKVDVQQSQFALPVIVIAYNTVSEDVLIGSEVHTPGKPARLNYSILSAQLRTSAVQELELPVLCGETQNGLQAAYDYASNGLLYIRSFVPQPDEIRHRFKQEVARKIPVLTIVQPSSGKSLNVRMQDGLKTMTDFNYIISGNQTRVVGFFGDMEKDPSGIDKLGLFYADIDNSTLAETSLKYTWFEKTSLNKLFPRSRGGRRKNVEQPSAEELLNTRFDIEAVFPMEDGSIVLFFNRKYNYTEITSRSGLDGRNVYTRADYCEKNNVSAIRLAANGKILWTGNQERNTTYEGTDIADLRVLFKANRFYVFYGTERKAISKRSKRKKLPDLRDNVDYITFDPETGRAKKHDLPVNEEKTPEKEMKTVDPNSFWVYDNQIFFHKMIVRQQTIWTVANILCFPSIYYSVLSGNVKCGKGEVGVLTLKEGKPPRKKNRN